MEVLYMDEFIKSLDLALNYLTHEIQENKIIIVVESNRKEILCPFCGKASSRVHSIYQREFQDLPLLDKQVVILLNNRKYFCYNQDCSHRTFAERFDFFTSKCLKTTRLIEKILKLSTMVSSVSASQILKGDMTIVSKSTICNLLKKNALHYG
jgi:transposase